MDALELGGQFMRQRTGDVADAVFPAVLARRIPEMTAEEAQAFIAGAADTLTIKAQSGMRPARQVAGALDENQNLRTKLVATLGRENAERLFNQAMSERTFAQTDRTIRGGSDPAGKLLSALDEAATGDLPTSPNSIAARLRDKVAVRGRIAQMLTDTDALNNRETIDRIGEIITQQQRRPRALRGAAGGGGQIQE